MMEVPSPCAIGDYPSGPCILCCIFSSLDAPINKVTGVKKGTVTITATAVSGKAASVKITVN